VELRESKSVARRCRRVVAGGVGVGVVNMNPGRHSGKRQLELSLRSQPQACGLGRATDLNKWRQNGFHAQYSSPIRRAEAPPVQIATCPLSARPPVLRNCKLVEQAQIHCLPQASHDLQRRWPCSLDRSQRARESSTQHAAILQLPRHNCGRCNDRRCCHAHVPGSLLHRQQDITFQPDGNTNQEGYDMSGHTGWWGFSKNQSVWRAVVESVEQEQGSRICGAQRWCWGGAYAHALQCGGADGKRCGPAAHGQETWAIRVGIPAVGSGRAGPPEDIHRGC
jgi:hypothetical protein